MGVWVELLESFKFFWIWGGEGCISEVFRPFLFTKKTTTLLLDCSWSKGGKWDDRAVLCFTEKALDGMSFWIQTSDLIRNVRPCFSSAVWHLIPRENIALGNRSCSDLEHPKPLP